MNDEDTVQKRKNGQLGKKETEEATKTSRQEHKKVPDTALHIFSCKTPLMIAIFNFIMT